MNFKTSFAEYENDLMELVRAFEQNMSSDDGFFVSVSGGWKGENEFFCEISSNKFDNFNKQYHFNISDAEKNYESGVFSVTPEIVKKRLEKRYLKIALYRALSFLTGINLPYGALTGIRPTKLFADLQGTGRAEEIFLKDFSVSKDKVDLIKNIVEIQKNTYPTSEDEIDVFVNIPFCPTRCVYCSFVSVPIAKHKKLLEYYKNCLISELSILKNIIKEKSFIPRAVYVGGGTPTSLPPAMLAEILKECNLGVEEFTVEAGRPDTITKATVKALLDAGVTRVSINPQTFNEKTLETIGRKHTSTDILKAYKLCKPHFGINMDLIAMLPGESFEDFKNSVDKTIALSPDNITVHMLAMKKGSELKLDDYKVKDSFLAERMTDYSYQAITGAGYLPYYMYRQKYSGGSLENVGYTKKGKECVYNIDIMEERTPVIAAGAGAISKKLIRSENRIERQANFKGVEDYLNRFTEVLSKTEDFWM